MAPYSKWLGTMFSRLPIAGALLPHLHAIIGASKWQKREEHLAAIYRRMAEEHNSASITESLSTETRNYYGRPYQVIFAGRFAEAICATIEEPALRHLAEIGAVDQFTDCVAVHSNAKLAAKLKVIYDQGESAS